MPHSKFSQNVFFSAFFNTSTPLWQLIVVTTIFATVPAILLTAMSRLLLSRFGINLSSYVSPSLGTSLSEIIGIVLVFPFIETVVLGVLLTFLKFFISNRWVVTTISALLWGCLHASLSLLWFVGPAWLFFVWSNAFLVWRKENLKKAVLVSFVPHMLNNGIAIGMAAAISNFMH